MPTVSVIPPVPSAPRKHVPWKQIAIGVVVLLVLAIGALYATVRYVPVLSEGTQIVVPEEEMLIAVESVPGTVTRVEEGGIALKTYTGLILPEDFTVRFDADTAFMVRGELKEESAYQAEFSEYQENYAKVRQGDRTALTYFDTHGEPDPYTYAEVASYDFKEGEYVVVLPLGTISAGQNEITAKAVYIGGSGQVSGGLVSVAAKESIIAFLAPLAIPGSSLLARPPIEDDPGGGGPIWATEFYASPTSISPGGSTVLYWSSDGSTACTGTNFSTGGATYGSVAVAPGSTTTYTVDCTVGGLHDRRTVTINVVAPPAPRCSYSPPNSGGWSGYSEAITWDLGSGQYFSGLRLRSNCDFTSSANGCMAARIDSVPAGNMFYTPVNGSWTAFQGNLMLELPAGQFISGIQFRGNCDFSSSEDGCMSVRVSSAAANTSGYRTNAGYWTSPGGSDAGYTENANYDLAPGEYISGIDFRQNCDGVSSENDCIRIKVSYYTVQDGLCGISDLVGSVGAAVSGPAGTNVTLSGAITNYGPGSTVTSVPNTIQVCNDGSCSTYNGYTPVDTGAIPAGGSAGVSVVRTLPPTPGTYYYRVCANINAAWSAYGVPETDYGNNCSGWQYLTATSPDVTPSAASGPTSLAIGQAGSWSAVVYNVGNASTGVNVPVAFAIDDAAGNRVTEFTASGPIGAGGSVGVAVSHAFSIPGTYNIIPCADVASPWNGTFNESNEGNNCGPAWLAITVYPAPTASLSLSPTSVAYGGSSTISWSSGTATSCTGTGFNTGGATSGSAVVTATANTTYYLSCSGPGGTSPTMNATLTVGAQTFPDLTPGAIPNIYIPFGQPVTVTGTVQNIGNAATGASFNNMFVTNLNSAGTAWNTAVTAAPVTGNLGVGGTASFSYTFPASTFAAPGAYQYADCVDVNAAWAGLITESNENNNCYGGVITMTIPDYTAATGGALSGIASTNITLSGTVSNIGNGSSVVAVPNTIQVCDTPACANYNQFSAVNSGVLAAGGSQAISAVRTLPPTPGTYYYRVCANINSTWTAYPLAESNNANNCGGWQTLTVNVPIPASPTNLTATCNAAGTMVSLGWDATPGATSYALRMDYPANNTAACTYGWLCATPPDQITENYAATAISYPTTPGYAYSAWIHAGNASGGSAASTVNFTCSGAADLTAGSVTPTTAVAGTPVTLSSTVSNTGNAASGSFPILFQVSQGDVRFNSAYLAAIPTGSSRAGTASYTFATPGTYQVRACANNNTSWVNIVTETDYANNCSGWANVVVGAAGSVSCTVSPASVPTGGSATYTATPANGAGSPYAWTAGDGGSYGTASTVTRTFATPGTYAMSVGASGAAATATCPFVAVATTWCTASTPVLSLTASSARVKSGNTTTLSWSASGVNGQNATCTVTGPGVSWTSPVSVAPVCSVPSGSATPTITTQSTYTLNCGGGQTKSVIVNVIPNIIEF
jgi:hypothetical protein